MQLLWWCFLFSSLRNTLTFTSGADTGVAALSFGAYFSICFSTASAILPKSKSPTTVKLILQGRKQAAVYSFRSSDVMRLSVLAVPRMLRERGQPSKRYFSKSSKI